MPGNGAYCASKGGLIRYLESLRAELREHGVRVLTVSPGYVDTGHVAGNTMRMPGLLAPEAAADRIVTAVAGRREKMTVPRRTRADPARPVPAAGTRRRPDPAGPAAQAAGRRARCHGDPRPVGR